MAKKIPDETLIQIEEAQAALRDSFERAHELVSEARLTLRQQKTAKPTPPMRTGPGPG